MNKTDYTLILYFNGFRTKVKQERKQGNKQDYHGLIREREKKKTSDGMYLDVCVYIIVGVSYL